MTECTRILSSHRGGKPIDFTFDQPGLTSDAGVALLAQLAARTSLLEPFADLIPDERDPARVVHPRIEQVKQAVFQIAAGYEDQNDADFMRRDPALTVACRGSVSVPLSSQPTLSRFENAAGPRDVKRMLRLIEQRFVDDHATAEVVILDIDATDFETHGAQQGSLFNGHYRHHALVPFMIFDGDTGQLASVVLRNGRASSTRGCPYVLERIVRGLRATNPKCMIVIRGDSHYASPRLVRRLRQLDAEIGGVFYLFGLAKNSVLTKRIKPDFAILGTAPGLRFRELDYRARTWNYTHRVIAKIENTELGPNPRFIVTNIEWASPEHMYHAYCERGRAELMIKDFKCALRGDRVSLHSFWANFFRVLLHSLAYELMRSLRVRIESLGAIARHLGRAQFDTIRIRVLKVAAVVTESVRRVRFQLPDSYPDRELFRRLLLELSG